MGFCENLLEFFKQPEEKTKDSAPEGVCPVCWGYQEYDHKIRVLLADEQLDVNHKKKKDMIMRKFVKKHIDGIRLLTPEEQACPKCAEPLK
ncbi:hypothetical protein ACV07N_13195 [Roseivirga echinicomitans]